MQFVLNGLVAGAQYSLLAFGFALLFGTSRFFNLSYGGVFAAGAYAMHFLLRTHGCPVVLAAPISLLICGGLAGLLDSAIYRPMRRHRATPLALLLASLACFAVMQNAISIAFGDATLIIGPRGAARSLTWLGARITVYQTLLCATAVAGLLAFAAIAHFTRFGRYARALADDAELALVRGVPVDRVILTVSVFVGVCYGALGVLAGYDTGLVPLMGFAVMLKAVVASVIGGIDSPFGAAIGGLCLGVFENLLLTVSPSQWQDPAVFLMLALFLLLRPTGLFGRRGTT
jgi:branched-subunit amino acid ABC-type transport system permease component